MKDANSVQVAEDLPQDRLGEIAKVALDAVERENPDLRRIVMLFESRPDGSEMGQVAFGGYGAEGDTKAQIIAAQADIIEHIRALAVAHGYEIRIVPRAGGDGA